MLGGLKVDSEDSVIIRGSLVSSALWLQILCFSTNSFFHQSSHFSNNLNVGTCTVIYCDTKSAAYESLSANDRPADIMDAMGGQVNKRGKI